MTAEQYLRGILKRYEVDTSVKSRVREVYKIAAAWAKEYQKEYVLESKISGSFAKGTANNNGIDIDVFISYANNTPGDLRSLYKGLYKYLDKTFGGAKARNVSIKVIYDNYKIDVVPGRKQKGPGQDHSLYSRRRGKWLQTNIDKHISYVTDKKRKAEIRLGKIWRDNHDLDFPSFCVEMAVIKSLYGKKVGDIANNFSACLVYFRDNLMRASLYDPANTNNDVMDDMDANQKLIVSSAAKASLNKKNWNDIIW